MRMSELQTLTIRQQNPGQRIEDVEADMEAVHEAIKGIELEKEKVVKIFSILRECLSKNISILQRQLEECLATKASYDKFLFLDLNAVEMESYALGALISISNAMRDTWKKHLAQVKIDLTNFFSRF